MFGLFLDVVLTCARVVLPVFGFWVVWFVRCLGGLLAMCVWLCLLVAIV